MTNRNGSPSGEAFIAELRGIAAVKSVRQIDIAKATGLSESTISRLLRGTQRMPVNTYALICEALGVRPLEVMQAAQTRARAAQTRAEEAEARAQRIQRAYDWLEDRYRRGVT